MSQPIVQQLTGQAEHGQTLSYLHLPFEVPEGIARIDVRYDYSDAVGSDPRLTDGNTVDIGIFDPRGTAFMTTGFRGWSGSARREFFIGQDEATPGYLPGLLQAGIWHICLGLYKVAPQGCHYQVEITLTPGGEQTAQFPALLPLRPVLGPRQPNGWYRGELHCHTYHSDGDSDPLEVVRLAESLGLNFLAITDHNVLSHLARLNTLKTSLILIPGFEVTTYKGHWNVWGDHGWIDFRILDEDRMAQAVTEAAQRGDVVSCNHPRPYGPEWVYEQVENFNCIEVWNGPWRLFNHIALEYWEARLRQGKRYTAVGGSDSHFLHREHLARLGQPTTWIYCEGDPTAARLLEALRAGHVFLSESPTGPRLMLHAGSAMMGDTVPYPLADCLRVTVNVSGGAGALLQLHTARGCVYQQAVESHSLALDMTVDVQGSSYVRAQLVTGEGDTAEVRALTNPIYLKP